MKETVLFFEGKNRIWRTLSSIANVYGDKQEVYMGIELTKMFERNVRGEVRKLIEELSQNSDLTSPSFKGEVTVAIAPYTAEYNLGKVKQP